MDFIIILYNLHSEIIKFLENEDTWNLLSISKACTNIDHKFGINKNHYDKIDLSNCFKKFYPINYYIKSEHFDTNIPSYSNVFINYSDYIKLEDKLQKFTNLTICFENFKSDNVKLNLNATTNLTIEFANRTHIDIDSKLLKYISFTNCNNVTLDLISVEVKELYLGCYQCHLNIEKKNSDCELNLEMCCDTSIKSNVIFNTVVYASIDSITLNPLKSKKYILKEKVDSTSFQTILENMNPEYRLIPIVPLLYCPNNMDIFTFACNNIYLDLSRYGGNFSLNILNSFKKDSVIITTNLYTENTVREKFYIYYCKIKYLKVSNYPNLKMYFYYSVFTNIVIDYGFSLYLENCVIEKLTYNRDNAKYLELKSCNIKLLVTNLWNMIKMDTNTKIECIEYIVSYEYGTIMLQPYSERFTIKFTRHDILDIIADSVIELNITCDNTKLNRQFNIRGNVKTIQILKEYINNICVNNLRLDTDTSEYYIRKNTLKYYQYAKKINY